MYAVASKIVERIIQRFVDRKGRKETRAAAVYRAGKQLQFSFNAPLFECAREEGCIL